MAKAPKRTTIAASEPPRLMWNDWMPLSAAFAHIQQVVGDEQLGAEDLRLRLVTGEVEAQERRVTPGGGIEIIPLTPEAFKYRNALFDDLSDDLGPILRSRPIPFHGRNIFLRRADVYRVWPTRPTEPASQPDERPSKQLPPMPPKGIGRKTWLVGRAVWALWCGGYRWPKQEDLLKEVNERLGHDQWASLPTLKIALAYLRKEGFIDL
jgi:hypothetical protein